MVMRCPGCSTMVVESMTECPMCHRALGPDPVAAPPDAAGRPGPSIAAWPSSDAPGAVPSARPGANRPSQNTTFGEPVTTDAATPARRPTVAASASAGADGPARGVPPEPAAGRPDHSGSHRGRNVAITAGAFVLVLALAAAAFLVINSSGGTKALAVTLQPIGDPGPSPFTASVATISTKGAEAFAGKAGSRHNGTTPATTATRGRSTSTKAITTRPVSGDTSGFYGVDAAKPPADTKKLTRLVTANPTTQHAWASAMGIDAATISSTIGALTPVLLGGDTAVTVHHLDHGRPVAYQAILQTGTPVLVDVHGAPVVDATSGDPLTKPVLGNGETSLEGHRWHSFDRHSVAQITPASKPLTAIEGTDIQTGKPTTIGAGNTVTLNGYLVSNDKGVSVVSFDGKKTTQIVDQPVLNAFSDGAGGVIYQKASDVDPMSIWGKGARSIWHLAQGQDSPTRLIQAGAGNPAVVALGTGRFDDRRVLFYSSLSTASDGSGSKLIMRDLEAGKDNVVRPPQSFVDGGTAGYLASIASAPSIGNDFAVFNTTQGTVSALTPVDRNLEMSDASPPQYCGPDPTDPSSGLGRCDALLGPFVTDSKAAIYSSGSDFDGGHQTSDLIEVDFASRKITSRTHLDLDLSQACHGFAPYASGDSTRMVISFGPDSDGNWPDCPALSIDLRSLKVTKLPITGIVTPLDQPIIRRSGTASAPVTTTPTTTTPTTTLPPATTAPPTVPTTAQPSAAAPSCPTAQEVLDVDARWRSANNYGALPQNTSLTGVTCAGPWVRADFFQVDDPDGGGQFYFVVMNTDGGLHSLGPGQCKPQAPRGFDIPAPYHDTIC